MRMRYTRVCFFGIPAKAPGGTDFHNTQYSWAMQTRGVYPLD